MCDSLREGATFKSDPGTGLEQQRLPGGESGGLQPTLLRVRLPGLKWQIKKNTVFFFFPPVENHLKATMKTATVTRNRKLHLHRSRRRSRQRPAAGRRDGTPVSVDFSQER